MELMWRVRRIWNRPLQLLARFLPGAATVRPALHRLRGVKIYGKVFIGEDVIIENEHPERVEIHEGTHIGLRSVILAHFRGEGRVIIHKNVIIAIQSTIFAFSGETIEIGEGAGVGACSLVRRSVPPHIFVAGSPASPKMRITVPFGFETGYEEYRKGLVNLTEEERKALGRA